MDYSVGTGGSPSVITWPANSRGEREADYNVQDWSGSAKESRQVIM
jgi:hypothetical protein